MANAAANAVEALERLVGRLNWATLGVCKAAAICLIVIMTAIIVTAVFFRYVLNDSIAWSEEIAKFVMVWMTFIVTPIGLKTGAHIAVEAISGRLGGRAGHLMQVSIFLAIILLMAMFVKEASFLTWSARIQRASTIDVSILYVYAAMPIGCAVTALVAFEFLLKAMKGFLDPARVPPRVQDPATMA